MPLLQIVKKTKSYIPTKVYDIGIENGHHYLLSNGAVSHNSYFPQKKQGGGRGPEYMASSIITLSKSKDKTTDGDIIGSIITAKIAKGRLTKENMEIKTKISYQRGLDRYYGLLELAEEHGIVKQVGKQYEFPDGTKAFKKNILAKPEEHWTKDVLDKIDDVVGKEFQYGGGSDSIDVGDEVVTEEE